MEKEVHAELTAEQEKTEARAQVGEVDPREIGEANGEGGREEGGWQRNGKVARLPLAVRERVNEMLQDGVKYAEIIERLGEEGKGLSVSNVSRWRQGGHQDWLKKQFWREEICIRGEAFIRLLAGNDRLELPEGGLQVAVIGICESLKGLLEPGCKEQDPNQLVRVSNALARLSRSILQLQQYRDACTQARLALEALKDPSRKLSETETRTIIRHVDEILGLAGGQSSRINSLFALRGPTTTTPDQPADSGAATEPQPL